jgi:hypothetical protein
MSGAIKHDMFLDPLMGSSAIIQSFYYDDDRHYIPAVCSVERVKLLTSSRKLVSMDVVSGSN